MIGGVVGLVAVLAAVGAVLLAFRADADRRLSPERRGAGALGRWAAPVPGALPSRTRRRVVVLAALAWLVSAGLASPWAPLATPLVTGIVHVVLARLPAGGDVRRTDALRASLPEVCTLLAVGIDAGLPLRVCVAAISDGVEEPMAGVLRRVVDRTALGATDADAWSAAAAEPALASLAGALARSVGSGVALGGLLRDLAREARRDRQSAALSRARQVGVSSVLPLMVCFLPSFFLIGVVPVIGSVLERMFS